MSPGLVLGIALLGVFFGLLFFNTPIGIALGASSVITLFLFDIKANMFANIMYTGLAKYALLSVPFFILAGVIMDETGISTRIIDFVMVCVGSIRGGLAITSLIVAVFWGAVSGSGVATVAALGVVLIPAMIKHGYPRGFSASILAAAAGLSILIPPSIPFILFGTLANVSVGGLFLAGIIPGLFIAGLFFIYIIWFCRKHNLRGSDHFSTRAEIWDAFKKAFFGLLTPVIILGGIYSGVFTPTEAAIVAVWYAIIIGLFVYRSFDYKALPRIFCRAGITSSAVMLILANAAVFAYIMLGEGVAASFSKLILSFSTNSNVILALIMIIMIIAGFFLDGNSITYICTPLFLPVITSLGKSAMWLGVMMSAGILVGLITPPVAANLYPAAKIADISLVEISKSIIWFVLVGILGAFVLLYLPEISLFLPRIMGYNVN